MKYLLTILLLTGYAYGQDSAALEIEKRIAAKMKEEDSARAQVRKDADDEERRNPAHRVDSVARREHEKIFNRKKVRGNAR